MRGIGNFPSYVEEEFDDWVIGEDEPEFSPVRRSNPRPEHMRHMLGHEVDILRSVFDHGSIYHRDDDDPRYKSNEQIRADMMALYNDLRCSRLYEEEYILVGQPDMYRGVEVALTDRGYKAVMCAEQDLLWHMGYCRPDPKRSVEKMRGILAEAYWPGEDVFQLIDTLRSPAFDCVRAEIPAKRFQLWRDRLYLSDNPRGKEWETVKTLDLPGLLRLRRDIPEYYHAAWKKAFRRSYNLKDSIWATAFALPGNDFADVRALAMEKHIEAWIAAVQEINHPQHKMFAEVEALSEDYALVKAEAFLQKMKCWTPLDKNGLRT